MLITIILYIIIYIYIYSIDGGGDDDDNDDDEEDVIIPVALRLFLLKFIVLGSNVLYTIWLNCHAD